MAFRVRGPLNGIAAVGPAGAPTRRVPTVLENVTKRFSNARVSEMDWLRADNDFLSVFFNSIQAPGHIRAVDGQDGNLAAVTGTQEQKRKLAGRISRHTPGKSLEKCASQVRDCQHALTELREKTNRYRDTGIKKEKLPRSVGLLVEAEDRAKKADPNADVRNLGTLQRQREVVIAEFKPAAAVDIQRQIDQSKKDLQAAVTAVVRSLSHGEADKYVSDEAYADYEAAIQEAIVELKTMQDELDALRTSLDPLALVDARAAIRDDRKANSPKAKCKEFAWSWKGLASGVVSVAATAGFYVSEDPVTALTTSSLGVFGVYALGAVAGAVVIGGAIAGITWILSDDEL